MAKVTEYRATNREWELPEKTVRQIANLAPEGVLPYEGNEAFWKEFLARLDENDVLFEGYHRVMTSAHPSHPDFKRPIDTK
jgi:hypothetical protein